MNTGHGDLRCKNGVKQNTNDSSAWFLILGLVYLCEKESDNVQMTSLTLITLTGK